MAERNVLNAAEARDFVALIARGFEPPALRDWAERAALRWILRHHDEFSTLALDVRTGLPVLRGQAAPALPYGGELAEWARADLAAGRPLLVLRFGGRLQKRLRETLAYLAERMAAVGGFPGLDGMGFERAEALARVARAEGLKRRADRPDRCGGRIAFRHRDAVAVELATPEALRDEGVRMANCVGGFAAAVRARECSVFSLRDRAGQPKATVEIAADGAVLQMKGFANGAVPAAFRPALRAFLRARGARVIGDVQALSVRAGDLGRHAEDIAINLHRPQIRALLEGLRYSGGEAGAAAEALALFRLLYSAGSLSPYAKRILFDALAPAADAPIRERPRGAIELYGGNVELVEIEIATAFVNLAGQGWFAGLKPEAARARALVAATQDALAALAFRDDARLYLLGPYRRPPMRPLYVESPADLLHAGSIAFKPIRDARHRRLREAANRAKRAALGLRALRSPAHERLRWLLDGSVEMYAM